MKTNVLNNVQLGLLLLISVTVFAQKPNIQFQLEMVENTTLYIAFEHEIDELKNRATDTLAKGLNEYIGFLNFTTDDSPQKLTVTINKKDVVGSEHVEEYYLYFEAALPDPVDNVPDPVLFLNSNDFESVLSGSDALLRKLSAEWEKYLKGKYNEELVKKLFHEVPLNLPDNSHYYSPSGGDKEAIIPFRQEMLKINPAKSEYEIDVIGIRADGTTTQDKQKEIQFRGLVEEQTLGVSPSLLKCIRLGLKELPDITLDKGRVYIKNYRRKLYQEQESEEDNSEF